MIDVYVPHRRSIYGEWIARGSGIVGTADRDREVLDLYFEGNVRDAVNIETYADKVQVAHSRQKNEYPTKARIIVDPADFLKVGRYDPDEGRVLVDSQEELERWLGVDPIPPEQLFTSGGDAGGRRKWERIAAETSDPALRIVAQKKARQFERRQRRKRED